MLKITTAIVNPIPTQLALASHLLSLFSQAIPLIAVAAHPLENIALLSVL